jgi:signal peptidase II
MRAAGLTAGIVFVLDQVTKVWIVHGLELKSRLAIDVLPPYLNLRMAWNTGVNFGLFSGGSDVLRWALVVLSLAIALGVWLWVRRMPAGRMVRISAGLLVGGALGNAVDRVLYGAVADFLNMSCCGWDNPWAFNVADIAIFAGAFGLLLFAAEPEGRGADKTP